MDSEKTPEIIITGTYGEEKNMACEDWPANADHMAAVMVDAGAEIDRLQRRVVELEAESDARRMRIEALEHGRDAWSEEVRRLRVEAAEQRKRAEEAEANWAKGRLQIGDALEALAMSIKMVNTQLKIIWVEATRPHMDAAAEKRAEEAEARIREAELRVEYFASEAGRAHSRAAELETRVLLQPAAIEKARQEERERCAGLAWKVGLGIEAYGLRQEISDTILASEPKP